MTINRNKLLILIVLPVILFFVSLFLGRYPVAPGTVLKILADSLVPGTFECHDTARTVILQVRLPRILLAMLVGAGLSISGATFQGMFRNPLVSPYILGVCSGAGFGAALAILCSESPLLIQVSAFSFGLAAVTMAYTLSRVSTSTPVLMMVLSGVVLSALFSALISLAKYVADPYEKLPAIVFWLMGSLSGRSLKDFGFIVIPILMGTTGLLLVRWRINVMSLGHEEARTLGVNIEVMKGIVITCATVITAAAVCVSGVIGWVGLVIPHIGRMLVGPDHRVLLPATLAIGAAYLLMIDNLARILTATEIPLGILTAIVGAPFFAYLLRRTKGGWE
ncbi:MAG: iron ABC transporter permease [Thermodesulfobacteriota bacterium]|nr:iron ABC transporter permease [Thermodesulfobacteriota bacterium]